MSKPRSKGRAATAAVAPVPLEDLVALAEARHPDPFGFLGRHGQGNDQVLRCFIPRAQQVFVEDESRPMARFPDSDLFEYRGDPATLPERPKLLWDTDDGRRVEVHDPYCFSPVLDPAAMAAFTAGCNHHAQDLLGAHRREIDGIDGTLFAAWAPHAQRVSVVGDFNEWDGRRHPMRRHTDSGIWELFVPGLTDGRYKFELRNSDNGEVFLKSDPFARWSEQRPATASLVPVRSRHRWGDQDWLRRRPRTQGLDQPLSIYEVHLGSWRRRPDGGFLGYVELAQQLCDYVSRLGFTHIELLPMKEHPLDESWGYQSTGYFAPTSRHGEPDDFRAFVDHCHRSGIGVILDWVPAHFPRDAHALARFDGSPLFEYADPWKAEHRDWGTLVFNYERNEVRSFLVSSALYWLQEFHVDGLRVDAVASMLYLNFSRQAEQWAPNRYGGHHNLEAIEFIRELNTAVREHCPDCLMIAEESSDWHGVTHPVEAGGLGFHLKWNMGWMHDSLNYMAKDPVHRRHHHDWLTFAAHYAFNEQYLLPLSHDEVVHLKKSLFGRMPGDEWQRFANLRLLYSYQWVFPGKQLLFMGGEFAQAGEWDAGASLPWGRAEEPLPKGIMRLLADLNHLQASHAELSAWDGDPRGFEWLQGEDAECSVIAYLRHAPAGSLVVVLNFTPEPRPGYRLPLHAAGRCVEVFNSDARRYGGSGMATISQARSQAQACHGREHSLELDLPPLAVLVLKYHAD
ncbi:MAG: 1,4-alpha-glucan branching protein GlgB [Xanthomonadales bacterium]|nr:1,4-alpha-glucan branching protein GlgB [Xanthomonadales bacterium]